MKEIIYEYSQGDLLSRPNSYMYPPFKGRKFLDSYFASRLDCVVEILEYLKAESFPNMDGPTPDVDNLRKSPGRARDKLFKICLEVRPTETEPASGSETAAFLCGMLGHMEEAGALTENKHFRGMVRRFEISKKLPGALTPPKYSLGGEPILAIEPYAHFTCLLGLAADTSGDLRLLNCLLKVCDLLCSGHGQSLLTLEAGPFSALGLVQETMLIQSLLPE